MEDKRLNTEIDSSLHSSAQNKYFSNVLKNETKRFSSLVLSNSINSIEDKKIYFKIFLLTLQKSPQQRTEDEVQAIAKILKQESLFPEFKHNITILRLIAKKTKVKHLQPGHFLYTCDTKDENIYKVLKGEVTVKKPKDGTIIVKNKADLLQKFEDFKVIKDIQVFAKDQSYIIALNYHQYQQALKLQRQNRTIMQMLTKTAIFSKFKRKEIQHLIQNSSQICLVSKQTLFYEGQFNNGCFYFLVQGELAVYKNNTMNKRKVVCYLTQGSLIGEELLFENQKPRSYTVSTQSSHAKILKISCSQLNQTIEYYQLNPKDIFTKKYQDFLLLRDKHYVSKLEENSQIKTNFRPQRIYNKLSPKKQERMSHLLKDVQNFTIQLTHKEKLLQKKYQIGKQYKDCKLISVERPLFSREDFPNLRSQLIKRFGLNQVKSKYNFCNLPHL